MVMTRIFKRREKEEGRKEGRREAENELIEADAQREPGETLQQAVERLRREKENNG